jgi:hypothetical protein
MAPQEGGRHKFHLCDKTTPGRRKPTVENIVPGVFTPVLAKHSKSFSLIDCIAPGVDRMQRNFGSMRKQVETWQGSELTDLTAKLVIYEAFVEGKLEAPKHLVRTVHDLYFEVRGIPVTNNLESLERVYFGFQGTGPYPAVQGERLRGRCDIQRCAYLCWASRAGCVFGLGRSKFRIAGFADLDGSYRARSNAWIRSEVSDAV